jgi:hypothetical protein
LGGLIDVSLIPSARQMGFMQGHPYFTDALATRSKPSGFGSLCHALENIVAEKFRGRLLAFEHLDVIEISVIDRLQSLFQGVMGTANINNNIVFIEFFAKKSDIDNEGCPMHPLRGTEKFTFKGMGNHDVVTDFKRKHELFPSIE